MGFFSYLVALSTIFGYFSGSHFGHCSAVCVIETNLV